MKILVTGGAGYIGGTVTQLLLDRGHTVVVYDNLYRGKRSMVPSGATFLEGDVADTKRLEEIFADGSFAGVMHFAALIEAGESMTKPEIYFRNNTAATLGLLEAMVKQNLKKLVFSSTAAVYGEPKSTPIVEEAELSPTNAYGESKLLVEQMLAWMHRVHGLRYASLRYFNVAGAIPGRGEAHEPESHLIPLILDVAIGRRANIKIFGHDYPTPDGTCIRDYIHVDDLGSAHVLALEKVQPASGLQLNLGTGRGYSVREVIDACRRVTGHAIPETEGPRRPGHPPELVADSSRAQRALNWRPQYNDIESIVRTAWKWHSSHPRGYGN